MAKASKLPVPVAQETPAPTPLSFLQQLATVTQVHSTVPVNVALVTEALTKDGIAQTPVTLSLFAGLSILRLSMAEVEQLMEIYSKRDYDGNRPATEQLWVDRDLEYSNSILHRCIVDDANNSIFAPHGSDLHSGHASNALSYHLGKELVDQCERVNHMYKYAKKALNSAVGESSDPKTSEGT
jgi:hypothetical protein